MNLNYEGRTCRLMDPVARPKARIQAGAATQRAACLVAGPKREEVGMASVVAVLVGVGRWQQSHKRR